jgi:hypothetical protein
MTSEFDTRSKGGDDLDRRFRALRSDDTSDLNWTDIRRRAHEPLARRPLHLRWGFAVGVALLLGSSLGFVLGSSNTPSGAAAPGGELGFLPARGWNVLQTATRTAATRPARQAIAANVPLRAEDDADGVPYATLWSLPRHGVVLVAKFTPIRGERDSTGNLPLRLRDAAPQIERSAQVRPTKPLGQYRLRAKVNDYGVEVDVYFGTRHPAAGLITAAQQQLDRLVVGSVRASNSVEDRALPIRSAAGREAVVGTRATSRIVDRTFRCTPVALGDGLRELDVFALPLGSREFIGGQNPNPSPGVVGVSSGGFNPTSDLVSVRAAAWERFRNRRIPEGVFASEGRCSSTRVSVRLSPTGLPGPPVQWSESSSCLIRGRVLVRVRAVLQSPATWQRIDGTYIGARRSVVEAALAIRSERGKPIAFVELGPAGKTRLWISSGCS